mmetsp:Transcript_14499/g.31523  ORF Transcript_14499/g.31523 Transcript_14499/m.31523 type:complete len:88 (+) Transcript_14499:210-473(+)
MVLVSTAESKCMFVQRVKNAQNAGAKGVITDLTGFQWKDNIKNAIMIDPTGNTDIVIPSMLIKNSDMVNIVKYSKDTSSQTIYAVIN